MDSYGSAGEKCGDSDVSASAGNLNRSAGDKARQKFPGCFSGNSHDDACVHPDDSGYVSIDNSFVRNVEQINYNPDKIVGPLSEKISGKAHTIKMAEE